MGGIGRSSETVISIVVDPAVENCGDVDLRAFAGGSMKLMSGGGGSYVVHTNLDGTWVPYETDDGYGGGSTLTIPLTTAKAKQMHSAFYNIPLARLVGPAGTLAVFKKG